ncbi:vanomycin resistance protein VanB [bacterium]|nr:MAG: vanomycin resistance protein VanB [bacterium]
MTPSASRVRKNVFAVLTATFALAAGAFALTAVPRETAIGNYSTSLKGRTTAQRHNAKLALGRLVGAEIKPGETFSFNTKVGTISRDQGYRKAPVSYNGQLIDDWGGGVCQTSTTLYNAALLGGMKIVERNRHRFAPSYVPPGRDAAVAFSNIDLRFTNPHPYPVRVEGKIEGDRLSVSLIGSEPLAERPQVVSEVAEMRTPETFVLGGPNGHRRVRNTGKMGCEVSVVRIQNGQRELISHDNYPAMNRVEQVVSAEG